MHTLLDQLQSRGLVDRGTRRGRGRPAAVRLTAEGLALLSESGARVVQLDAQTRARLGDADYHQLLRLLDRMEDAVDAARQADRPQERAADTVGDDSARAPGMFRCRASPGRDDR